MFSSVGVSGPNDETVDGPEESRDIVGGVMSVDSASPEKEKSRCKLIIEKRRFVENVCDEGVGEGLRAS